jgi:RNA polymerase sigma factor (sigma-70 family)
VLDVSQQAAFTTTHWSAVLCAGGPDSPASRVALESLCSTYWYPLYAHARRRGWPPDDAADYVQEFFTVLLRRNSLAQVGPERGRFRTFLLTSLDYFLRDQLARARTIKRGGQESFIPLDALTAEQRYALEPSTDETPDKAFDRRWASTLLQRAFERLQSEQEAVGKGALCRRLKPLLAQEVRPGDYDAVAAEFALAPNTVAKTVQRLRLRTREFLIEEVSQTVAAAGDAEQELRTLFG